jgi:hypothetical protein
MSNAETLASDPVNLHQLMSADNELQCPLFQRPYVWTKRNIDQLWADVDTIREEEFDARFLGALVFDNEFASTARKAGLYWVIDGQQRLTTLYLSLVALCEVAVESGDQLLSDEIADQYLLSRKSNNAGMPKLRPTLNDTRQFNKIMVTALGDRAKVNIAHEQGPADGNMRTAYELIIKHVRSRCVDAEGNAASSLVQQLRDVLLDGLEFVEIRLGEKHDANEVFDRLNKEGERLGIIDLIRNEALKRLRNKPDEAANLYAGYWLPFEESFECSQDRDKYFFPFALTKDSSVTKSRTFSSLTKRWNGLTNDVIDPVEQLKIIMQDLRKQVPAFNAVSAGKRITGAGTALSEQLRRLHDLGSPTVVYPYLLQAVTKAVDGEESQESVSASLSVIESFLVRRALVGLEPTGLHAVFKTLWDDAGSDSKAVRDHLNTATIAFPSDRDFEEAVMSAPLFRRRVKTYVIGELERNFTDGDLLKSFPAITVDHILPQNPDGEWLELFKDYERERWTDTWANLVPLSGKANSEKGRSSWAKTKEKLSNETVFSTTKHVYDDYEVWNVESLEKRAAEIAEWALQRWAG